MEVNGLDKLLNVLDSSIKGFDVEIPKMLSRVSSKLIRKVKLKTPVDSGVLRMQDAFSFAWSLYTSNVMPITQAEYEDLKNKRNGIIGFMKKLSDPDYIKEQGITSENMGVLYEQELTKATTPEVIENNTSYAKRSANR